MGRKMDDSKVLHTWELRNILDRGLILKETYRDGEYQGTDWDWKASVEDALRNYFAKGER
jgi:hypothetical protein